MWSRLANRRVVAALILQVVGYAALLAVFPHSETSSVVEALRGVPTLLLVVVAIPAIPALVLTLAVGAVLSALGLPPPTLPALLLARGDVLFFASAYAVGVASAWANERTDSLAP